MPNLRDTTIRLYRQIFGDPSERGQIGDGVELFLDGNSAVAVCEAAISTVAALGGSYAVKNSELSWKHEHQRVEHNLFNQPLSFINSESPRGAMAAAIGACLTGQRASVFLSGADATGAIELLKQAAGKHLPLVVHVTGQALNGHGSTHADSHEALHLLAEAGAITLFAQNVQEAVDLTLISRVIAERSLVPVVIYMDQLTAYGSQAFKMPSVEMVNQFVGSSTDTISSLNPSQKMLFGDTRPRLPRWHDLDRPVLHGALFSAKEFTTGNVASTLYMLDGVEEQINHCFKHYSKLSGRHYQQLSTHNTDNAEFLVIAQGGAVEQLVDLSNRMRKQHKKKIGIVGVRVLRPFAATQIKSLVHHTKRSFILETALSAHTTHAPLMREITATTGATTKLESIIYGLGDSGINLDDLSEYILNHQSISLSPRFLGVHEESDSRHNHPKRQVLIDSLKRDYPNASSRLIPAAKKPLSSSHFSLQISHSGSAFETLLLNDIATILHNISEDEVRATPEHRWESWGGTLCDHITVGKDRFAASHKSEVADILVCTDPRHFNPATILNDQADILLVIDSADTLNTASARVSSHQGRAQIHYVICEGLNPEQRHEKIIGAVCHLFETRRATGAKIRKILEFRKKHKSHWGQYHSATNAEQLQTGYETVKLLDPVTENSITTPMWDGSVPMAVKHLTKNSDQYDNLPRFWDQVGVLYREGDPHLAADPYLATGIVPPLSSTFRNHAQFNTLLPLFRGDECSGCGLCWSHCPDSAIGATALSVKELLNGFVAITGADPLRPLVNKLASAISKQVKSATAKRFTFKPLLNQAFEQLQQKSPLSGERLESVSHALMTIADRFGSLPLHKTEALFTKGEQLQKDGGALLSLTVNSDACKGCGICASSCDSGVITMQQSADDLLNKHRQNWQIWEQIPDTASTLIEQVAKQSLNPIAAQMLSRHCAYTISGGDGAEAGSGEKIALRMVLSGIEYLQQPHHHQWLNRIKDYLTEITQEIRSILADALPVEDLDSMAHQLQQVKSRHVDLIQLIPGNTSKLESSGVDAPRLRRLIEIAQGLGDLQHRIQHGESGLGRSRYSLAISPGTQSSWAGVFPYNPFQVPTLMNNSGDLIEMSMGMIHGQIQQIGQSHALMHNAAEELKRGVSKQKPLNSIISWHQMDEDERNSVPPLVVIANSRELAGSQLSQLSWMLNSGLPVKVIAISDLGFGLENEGVRGLAVSNDHRLDAALSTHALFGQKAFVAQSSIAAPQHLNQSIQEMFDYNGPALVEIYAPSPLFHGIAPSDVMSVAATAVATRVSPLMRYNPNSDGLFGKRLKLEGNESIKRDWVEIDNSPHLPIDWMRTQRRFDHCFHQHSDRDAAPTPLADYLNMGSNSRANKSPVIKMLDDESNVITMVASEAVIEVIDSILSRWRVLQELAGEVTPFTDKVQSEIEAEVAAEHQLALDALRQEYEEKIAAINANHHSETANKIRAKLMTLAGYDPEVLKNKTVQ